MCVCACVRACVHACVSECVRVCVKEVGFSAFHFFSSDCAVSRSTRPTYNASTVGCFFLLSAFQFEKQVLGENNNTDNNINTYIIQ